MLVLASQKSSSKHRIIVLLFFFFLLALGFTIYKDYGMSWDEMMSRYNGIVTMRYVFKNNLQLLSYSDRYYGTIFEVLLVGLEDVFKLLDMRQAFLMRHLVTFLAFYISVFFFYLLCKNRFHSWKIGLLGAFFLVLSPRIFADSFYNSKDLVFLSVFIISIYTLIAYLNKKTLWRAILHAIACSFLIGIRVAGIIVPFFTIVFFILDFLLKKSSATNKKYTFNFLMYILALYIFTIIFWPILWNAPIKQFLAALREMSRFPAYYEKILYLGNYITAFGLPWHYIPVWIAITTPISYVVFFIIGAFSHIKGLLLKPTKFYLEKKDDLIFFAWFIVPLLSVILLKSALYDGWRHMYFIYPAFLLISLSGLLSFWNIIKAKITGRLYAFARLVFILFITFNCLNVARFMIRFHPYQNVYFNILVGTMQDAKKNFDLDYWGLSYRKALEYILQHDRGKSIKVYFANSGGQRNLNMLVPYERSRIVEVKSIEDAKYFVGNYRWHKEDYPYKNEFYAISIDGAKIMAVYKL